MVTRAKTYIYNPLISGSVIMVVGTNVANFIAYLYHLVFGRILGPSLYSELAVVISLVGLFFALLSFFNLVIVKFVSSGSNKQTNLLYTLVNKQYTIPILILSFLVLITTPLLSTTLNISSVVLIWVGPTVFFLFLYMVQGSFLQGLLKFDKTALLNILNALSRLLFGLLFYYLGFSLAGISLGIMLSYVLTWILGKYMLGLKSGKNKMDYTKLKKNVVRYAVPVFVMTLSMSAFIAIDVVLVKYFFDPYHSGLYASLSALGKIVFYGVIPVTLVMFPLVSKKATKGESTKSLLYLSFILALLIGLGILFLYWLFPNPVINVLFGEEYLEGSSYLVYFGIFSLFYTLDYLIVNYFLASGRTLAAYFVPFGVLIQIVGIYKLHDSIENVILASIIATLSLFIAFVIYGLFTKGKPKSVTYMYTESEF